MDKQVGTPRLSVVVIAYNMARELPRTLQSLVPPLQCGIEQDEYEIIVVDNCSSQPFDRDLCQSFSSNIQFFSEAGGSPSPAAAVNLGIRKARGEVIGVMIDGARMASPGLLRAALDASELGKHAIVGTVAFHLGNDVQMRSIKLGYNQEKEDRLLESVPWQQDGYRLFDISVFAGSSAQGWFDVPSETNALFMHHSTWHQLGGYDEEFCQPGGGLLNLDTWHRACNLQGVNVVMLLGEATFHQFHGGVATNSSTSKWRDFNKEYAGIRGHSYRPPVVATPHFFGQLRSNHTKSLLNSAYHISTVSENNRHPANASNLPVRPSVSNAPEKMLSRIQRGVMSSEYRGVPFFKSPFDIGIYLQLLSNLKPQTIIEIGTKNGGSALWFADMLDAANIENPSVISIDIKPAVKFSDRRITFLQGDAADLSAVLPVDFLQQLSRPFLVIEDSSHYYQHTIACLNFFHPFLRSGDYIVVEDGVVAQMPESQYRQYDDGPSRAIADFISTHDTEYIIDTALCDHYGYNLTYNPNGYLKKR